MHAGLPIVVSDNPTMADFVRRFDTGVVFESQNPQSLALAVGQALERLKRDPEWPRRIMATAPDYCWKTRRR